MPIAALAGVGSALIGASSARKAADAQSDAAASQLALQREIYDDTSARFQPYEDAGGLALQAYLYEMGLGAAPTIGGTAPQIQTITNPGRTGTVRNGQIVSDFGPGALGNALNARNMGLTGSTGSTTYRVGNRDFGTMEEAQAWANANPTGGTAYQGFTATPGYQFRFDQGTDAVNARAGSQGSLNSGRTLQDLMTFGQGIASEEYGNYMGRLAGLTDMGQASAGNQAAAGRNYAAGASQAYANMGNAQAAGYAGIGNALNSGLQTGIGLWSYQNNLDRGLTPSGWR